MANSKRKKVTPAGNEPNKRNGKERVTAASAKADTGSLLKLLKVSKEKSPPNHGHEGKTQEGL